MMSKRLINKNKDVMRVALFFGKDVSNEVVFNEEQERQLEKLRKEAAKAAGGK
jgi:hypothetical protein